MNATLLWLDIIKREVGGNEGDLGCGDPQSSEPGSLVSLGVRVVEFEPSDSRLGVAKAPAVIAGPENHRLIGAGVDRLDHDAVKEGGSGLEVPRHPGWAWVDPRGDVGLQLLVCVGLAICRHDAWEGQPLGCHPTGGERWFTCSHSA
jgi:hypothetical protein